MRFRFQIASGQKQLTEHQHAILSHHVREPDKLPPPGTDIEWMARYHNHTGDVSAILAEAPGLELTIESGEVGVTLIEHLVDRFAELERKLLEGSGFDSQRFNTRVSVHVPGLGLLLLNEFMALTSSCTDDLNKHIGLGWRVVAVCPQPDQRRPDYILGRTVSEA